MKTLYLTLFIALLSAQGHLSFTINQSKVPWTPVELPGVPPGLQQRILHDNKANGHFSAIVRFPKGFTEPAHFHTKCGHSIYILKGRLKSPTGDLVPGDFTYAAVNEVHGPFTAVQETEFVFYNDGPFDYHLAKSEK